MKAYGSLELTVSSPPQVFTEPLTLAQARTYLRIEESSPADPAQDELLSDYIAAAREVAEILQGRDLIPKQYDLALDLLLGHDAIAGAAYPLRWNSIYNFGVGYEIDLRAPLQSVDLFQHTDNTGAMVTLTEATDYVVDLKRSLVTPPWGQVWPFFTPAVTSSVLIRFTSGYPATHPFWGNAGKRVIQGIRYLVAQWWENRIPFEPGRVSAEFPNTVTDLLTYGARPRVH